MFFKAPILQLGAQRYEIVTKIGAIIISRLAVASGAIFSPSSVVYEENRQQNAIPGWNDDSANTGRESLTCVE